MSAVKRTKLVEIEYWDCGNPNHNHGSKDVAERCIEKQKRTTGHVRMSKDQYTLRNIKVTRMLIDGASLKEVANYIGKSTTTARSCVYRALRATGVAKREDWTSKKPYYYDTIREIQAAKDFWLPALDDLERRILADTAAKPKTGRGVI